MRIVQLTPGSGDQFYCENCLRDVSLVRAMRAEGLEVILVPMYLPLSLDGDQSLERTDVFFGGINVYLQQKMTLFRKTPRWLDRLFDARWLLKQAGKKAGMTSARQLGEMTLSMLEGPQGRQVKEIHHLVEFLASPENKPDVVILSNLLLAGLAGPIREQLGCKVVCWLQDEDGFVDGLGQPWASQVWQLLAEKISFFDLFLPVSRFFAHTMQKRLPIPDEKICVCPPGLEISKYQPAEKAPARQAIGYLGRMCHANGLDLMAEAFCLLNDREGMGTTRLLICGGMTSADEDVINKAKQILNRADLSGRTQVVNDFKEAERLAFLNRLTLLCSPVRTAPAYAMNVLEALACGVPFVAPKAGVYPEWAQLTGAGILYESNTPQGIAEAMIPLLRDAMLARDLGRRGRRAVEEHFDIRKTAVRLKQQFAELIKPSTD